MTEITLQEIIESGIDLSLSTSLLGTIDVQFGQWGAYTLTFKANTIQEICTILHKTILEFYPNTEYARKIFQKGAQ